jgi:hypothetical protein
LSDWILGLIENGIVCLLLVGKRVGDKLSSLLNPITRGDDNCSSYGNVSGEAGEETDCRKKLGAENEGKNIGFKSI